MGSVMFLFVMILMSGLVVLALVYLGKRYQKIFRAFHIEVPKWLLFPVHFILCIWIIYNRFILAAFILYTILLFLVVDFLRLICRPLMKKKKFQKIIKVVYLRGLIVLITALAVTIYAAYNAEHAIVKTYHVTTDKSLGKEKELKILMLSDIHVGTSVKEKQMKNLIKQVNERKADIICLCGDIFDESSSTAMTKEICQTFSKFQSKYGVYYVTGNHDADLAEKNHETLLKEAGVTILSDEAKLIDNRFYLVGRKDPGMGDASFSRASAKDLLKDLDMSYPILVLDHRPTEVKEIKEAGADLQLSGHTHAGQIVPGNWFVWLANDVAYGKKTEGDFSIIVGAGYGNWGFSIRTAKHCELVECILTSK